MSYTNPVDRILELEWDMFARARNAGTRTPSQEDKPSFRLMRKAQADIWSLDALKSYMTDLEKAREDGVNLMSVKYVRMMKQIYPGEYARLKDRLPPVSEEACGLCTQILKYHTKWAKEAAAKYPKLFSFGRPLTLEEAGDSHIATMDIYLQSEFLTYSENTLKFCLRDTENAFYEGINLSMEIMRNTASGYGYGSLDALEKVLNS